MESVLYPWGWNPWPMYYGAGPLNYTRFWFGGHGMFCIVSRQWRLAHTNPIFC